MTGGRPVSHSVSEITHESPKPQCYRLSETVANFPLGCAAAISVNPIDKPDKIAVPIIFVAANRSLVSHPLQYVDP